MPGAGERPGATLGDALFARSTVPMLLIDPASGEIVGANRAAVDFYGHTHQQLLALRITDINPLPPERVFEALRSVPEDGGRRFVFKHRLANGTIRDVEVASSHVTVGGRPLVHSIVFDVTERSQADEQLKRQAALINSLLDSFPDLVFFKNTEGVYLGCNPAFAEFVGRPRPAIVGLTDYEIFDRATAAAFREHDRRMLETREERHNEEWLTYPDGRRKLVDTLKTPYWGPGGELLGVLGISRDITARKVAEDELRAERDLFSAGPVATIVWAVTDGWPVHQVSSNTAEVIGHSPSEVLSPSFRYSDLVHPDDLDRVVAEVTRSQDAGQDNYENSYRLRRANGEYRWVHDTSKAVRNEDGEVVQVRGYLFDVTRQKLTELDLQRQRERLEQIIDGTRAGTWEWDVATGALSVNERWAEMFGYALDELGPVTFDTWAALAHEDDMRAARDQLDRHLSGELAYYECEIRARHKGGFWVWVLDRGCVVSRAADGTPLRMSGTHQDVTVRHHAQDQLMLANRQLEEAITKANEMAMVAEVANEAKSEFLANMSHEIRTPMNGIIGIAGLLLETQLSLEQRRFAELIRGSGESLLALVNDILDLSKVEAGKLVLECLDFDLRALLDEFSSMLALRAQAKGLEFTCAAYARVPSLLRGDAGRLRQILVNLVGNAIKFTERGGVDVRVDLAAPNPGGPDAPGVLLRCSVRDTGIGIPREKLGLLFGKFNQVDASTTRRYGGTGLGLAISRQLAERMGGEIGVESEPGRGTEFWFTVRLLAQAEAQAPADAFTASFRDRRVLIVDDSASSREALASHLVLYGVRESSVANADAALGLLREAAASGDPFQVAFLDTHMPSMGGDELAARVRSEDALAGTKLVRLVPLNMRTADASVLPRFAGQLSKPVRHDELHSVLIQVFERRAVPRTLPAPRPSAGAKLAGRKNRILLVEDNSVNQFVALRILSKLGCHADAVGNGREALEALVNVPYDLVLMDVQMPEMDGYEATRAVRSWGRTGGRAEGEADPRRHLAGIPIVAMTANAMAGDREACLACGMNDYLTKPVRVDDLGEMLARWLPPDDDREGAPDAPA